MVTQLRQLISRIGALFRSEELDRDFNEELESHFAMLVDEYVAGGMTSEEAAKKARLVLGGQAQLVQAHRAARGLPFFDAVLRDLRHALQILRRHPVVTLAAILFFCLRHHNRRHNRAAVILVLAAAIARYIILAQRSGKQGQTHYA